MSMALVVNGFATLVRDMGTSDAVIQRQNLTQRLLATTFWANVAFGAIAGLLLFLAARLLADFYTTPRLTPVVELMALSFLISGPGIVHQALLTRDLAFRQLALVETGATIAGSVVAIVAAVAGAGVYCLVAQMIAISGLTTIGVWAASRWRPSFEFALDDLRAIRSFTSNIVGYNILNYVARNADYLLIGRYLGAESLGYYTLAYSLLLFPLQMFTYSISRVTFPAYSAIQNDPLRIGRGYLRVAGVIASIVFPLMCGLLVLCDCFVYVVYGKTWSPAIPVIAVLAPVGMVQSIAALNGGIFKARGRADLQLRLELISTIAVVASFAIGLQWGIVGVASGYAIAEVGLLGYPMFAFTLRLLGLRVADLVRAVWRPLGASAVMAIVLLGTRALVSGERSTLGFSLLVFLGATVYLVVSMGVNRPQLTEIARLLRPPRKSDDVVVAGR
jgi:PST family polysaccharide transporter